MTTSPRRSMHALLAGLLLLLLALPGAATAQQGEPWWLHLSPLAGAVVASDPGEAPRPAAALQLELSHVLPFGFGLSAGYLAGSEERGAGEVAGAWAEGTFAYRFKLRFRGYIAPFAGPIAGLAWHDRQTGGATGGTAPDRWLARWFFGGRAGLDVPVGSGWPSVRVEVAYRRIESAGGLGGANVTTGLIGFRWSRPLVARAND